MTKEVEYKQRRPNGEQIARTITNINQNVADATLASVVGEISNLSQNTLTAITKIERVNLQIVPAQNIYTAPNKKIKAVNAVDDAEIYGNNLADSIFNTGANSTLSGGDGNDTITNLAQNAVISASGGDNKITSTGDNVQIFTGSGNDSILNDGDFSTISTGDGNDYVSVASSHAFISLGSGDDSVRIFGRFNTIQASGGDNTFIPDIAPNVYILDAATGTSNFYGLDTEDTLIVEGQTQTLTNEIYKGTTITLSGGGSVVINGLFDTDNVTED